MPFHEGQDGIASIAQQHGNRIFPRPDQQAKSYIILSVAESMVVNGSVFATYRPLMQLTAVYLLFPYNEMR